MSFIKALTVFFTLALTINSANATLIVNNTYEVEALELTEDFESFYARSEGNLYSSNTGLEILDSIVLFFAEYQGVTSLFGLLDLGTANSSKAELDLTIDDNSSAGGALIFLDDFDQEVAIASGPNELFVNFVWGKDPSRNDGFIYGIEDEGSFDIDLLFEFINGTPSDVVFLSFDDESNPAAISLNDFNGVNVKSGATSVSAPGSSGVILLALIFLVARRFRL